MGDKKEKKGKKGKKDKKDEKEDIEEIEDKEDKEKKGKKGKKDKKDKEPELTEEEKKILKKNKKDRKVLKTRMNQIELAIEKQLLGAQSAFTKRKIDALKKQLADAVGKLRGSKSGWKPSSSIRKILGESDIPETATAASAPTTPSIERISGTSYSQIDGAAPEPQMTKEAIAAEKQRQMYRPKIRYETQNFLKKCPALYEEISYERVMSRTGIELVDLEKLVEEMIMDGELKAQIKGDTIAFFDRPAPAIPEPVAQEKREISTLSVFGMAQDTGYIDIEYISTMMDLKIDDIVRVLYKLMARDVFDGDIEGTKFKIITGLSSASIETFINGLKELK